MRYKVLRDTREQKGWFFDESNKCVGTSVTTLKTGDYTIEGFEETLCIERKGSIQEWARNCVEPRFVKELDRMLDFEHKFILLEFEMQDILNYPHSANFSAQLLSEIKITGDFVLKKTLEFQMKYGVHIILCGQNGKRIAESIFRRIVDA